MSAETPRILLVTRADDAGSCSEANKAVAQSVNEGIIRNVSLMIPGPAAAELPRYFAGRDDISVGLHVTLNSEWEARRWGPILPASQVPSLVMPDGTFTHFPQDLDHSGFDPDEAIAEVEAQYIRARDLGLRIDYVDEHMGVGWLPGLRQRLEAFAHRENLLIVTSLPYLSGTGATPLDPLPTWKQCLEKVESGTHVLVTHPGQDQGEMRHFYLPGGQPGIIAQERDAETKALCDPAFPVYCRDHCIDFVRYSDVLPRAN